MSLKWLTKLIQKQNDLLEGKLKIRTKLVKKTNFVNIKLLAYDPLV